MSLSLRNTQKTKVIAAAISSLLIAAGAYLLITALSPLLISPDLNASNNSTIELLESTESKAEQSHLYIPKINVNVPFGTGDASALERGAWWRQPQNGNPVDGGNFVLSAHRFIMGLTPQQTLRESPFYHIDKLTVGDELIVDYKGSRYTYVVSKIYAVKPDAIEIEQRTDQPQLTLYSCTLGGSADGREVIVAKPLSE